ncbi:hypothetical protein GCM10009760_63580 [Kitasatospora kazusensis]|uniref:Competence protein CoiA-like protein n=1 Tax=Kitasatospora kazusensis TaxID=407974 RepID=A0ABP4KC86_9ACTN
MLGGAESDDPLILPLEAIELDAFRRHHTEDTFWCGLLLGGCGERLTTKLYTDRACHFAHFPDPTGLHVCGRRARDVSSADHLYANSAAAAWLKARGQQASISYGTPLGSVVDILWGRQARGLRLHLDGEVPPVWDDEEVEPVLGVSVPVDDETLVRRWYVHRVGFDSVGTARQVRIGTQAFARETEWFGLDECSMTPDGFRTPAVERIMHARSTRAPQGVWRPPAPTSAERQAQRPHPAGRLEAALQSGSRIAVQSAYRELEAAGPNWGDAAEKVAAVLEQAQTWLAEHNREREEMFGQLNQAVQDGEPEAVRSLLARVDVKAARDRTSDHHAVATRAADFLKDQEHQAARARETQRALDFADQNARQLNSTPPRPISSASRRKFGDPTQAAHRQMRDILSELRRLGHRMSTRDVLHRVDSLATTVKGAGDQVTPAQREEAEQWLARSRRLRSATATEAAVVPSKAANVPASRRSLQARTVEHCAVQAGPGRNAGRDRNNEKAEPPSVARRTAAAEPQARTKKKAAPAGPPRLPAESVAPVAAAVRAALKKAARERSTTTWSQLRRQLGNALPALHPDDQLEVLLRVEASTPAEEPLLSSLLAADASSHPAVYQRLANRLGRAFPAGAGATRAHWQTEVLRLQQLFRHR